MNEHGRAAQKQRVGAKVSRADYFRDQNKGKAVGRRVFSKMYRAQPCIVYLRRHEPING